MTEPVEAMEDPVSPPGGPWAEFCDHQAAIWERYAEGVRVDAKACRWWGERLRYLAAELRVLETTARRAALRELDAGGAGAVTSEDPDRYASALHDATERWNLLARAAALSGLRVEAELGRTDPGPETTPQVSVQVYRRVG